jgi:hypothetical protein
VSDFSCFSFSCLCIYLCSYTSFLLGFIEEICRLRHGMCWIPEGCKSVRRCTF